MTPGREIRGADCQFSLYCCLFELLLCVNLYIDHGEACKLMTNVAIQGKEEENGGSEL